MGEEEGGDAEGDGETETDQLTDKTLSNYSHFYFAVRIPLSHILNRKERN